MYNQHLIDNVYAIQRSQLDNDQEYVTRHIENIEKCIQKIRLNSLNHLIHRVLKAKHYYQAIFTVPFTLTTISSTIAFLETVSW